MSIKRRDFFLLMGSSASALVLSNLIGCEQNTTTQKTNKSSVVESKFSFTPINGPIPLETAGLNLEQQQAQYSTYEVVDDVVLPEGFKYQLIAAWGDKVGDSRFGYNN